MHTQQLKVKLQMAGLSTERKAASRIKDNSSKNHEQEGKKWRSSKNVRSRAGQAYFLCKDQGETYLPSGPAIHWKEQPKYQQDSADIVYGTFIQWCNMQQLNEEAICTHCYRATLCDVQEQASHQKPESNSFLYRGCHG